MLSAPGGVFVAWTTIDPRVTDPAALSHVVAHEIGHTFGLAECDTCERGSSVMTRYDGDLSNELGTFSVGYSERRRPSSQSGNDQHRLVS